MAYYPDLSPNDYVRRWNGQDLLSVGWLCSAEPFQKWKITEGFSGELADSPLNDDPVSEKDRRAHFLDNLVMYIEHPVITHRGFHTCDFCGLGSDGVPCEMYQGRKLKLGFGVSLIYGEGDKVFACPTLIFHYVVAHNYKPPAEFIQAVLTQPRPKYMA